MIAPDQTTFDYIEGKPQAPTGADWDAAVEHWRSLRTDADASYDEEIVLDASTMTPFVTWGTNPGQGVPLGEAVPDPESFDEPGDRTAAEKALEYMALTAGTPMREISVDTVFIGSCTNGRIEDLRLAAEVIKGRTAVDADTRLLVVPGSARVRLQAEDEGLDVVFKEAGAEWRGAGCSMCLGMNPDQLAPASAAPRRRTATSRAARARAAAPTWSRCRWPPPPPCAARSPAPPTCRRWTPERTTTWTRSPPTPASGCPCAQQRRHRPDHPGALPQARHPHGLRGRAVRRLARQPRLRAQRDEYAAGSVLVAGSDFGTGSSREHAVWAPAELRLPRRDLAPLR